MGMYSRAWSIVNGSKASLKIKSILCFQAIGLLFLVQTLIASAQITVDPSALGYQPTVETTNFVPTVNIVAPQSGGVSHNKYAQLNVGAEGVIYNNACSGSKTQLAGDIQGNPNLCAGGHANTILNEVTGSSGTILAGQTEVAGNEANVIYANNDGITCNGCGFINTTEVTLTTGTPTVGGGGAITLSTDTGMITVTRAGLDGSGASGGVNLVGKQISIDGIVKTPGSALVVGGSSSVDMATKMVTGGGHQGSSYAIDSSLFGGFQSGSIRIVGNDTGLGVRQLGSIHSINGDVVLESAGSLSVGQVTANADLDHFADNKTASVTLTAGGELRVLGDVFSSDRVIFDGNDIFISDTVDIDSLGEVNIKAKNNIDSGAQIQSLKKIVLDAANDLSISSGVIQSNESITINSNNNVNINRISLRSKKDINVVAVGQITSNDALYYSDGGLTFSADTISTDGQFRLVSAGNPVLNAANIDLGSALDWDAVTINGLQTLDVKVTGVLIGKNLNLNIPVALTNRGIIYSDGDLVITAPTFTNFATGSLIAEDRSNTVNNSSITLNISQTLTNDGKVISQNNLEMNSGSYTGSGLLSVGDLVKYSGGDFTQSAGASNSTQILANRLDIDSTGVVSLGGDALVAGDVDINAVTSVGFSGVFNGGTTTIKTGSLDLSNTAAVAVNTLDLDATGVITNAGYVVGQGLLDLVGTSYSGAGHLISDADIVYSGGDFTLASGGQLIGDSLTLTSSGNVDLSGETLMTRNATINVTSGAFNLSNQFGAIDVTIDAASATIGAAGKLSANDKLILNANAGLITNDGILNGTSLLDLDAGSYSGAGQLVSSQLVDIDTSGIFQQNTGGQIVTSVLDLDAGKAVTLSGIVSGSTSADIQSTASSVKLTGQIVGGDIDITGVGVDLVGGTSSIGGATVDIASGTGNVTNAGTIYSTVHVKITGQDYSGDGAIGTGSGGSFTFQGRNFSQGSNGTIIGDQAIITATGTLALSGETQTSNRVDLNITGAADIAGRVQSVAVTLDAASLTLSSANAEIFATDTDLTVGGIVDNSGSIYGSTTLNIMGTGVGYTGAGLLSAGILTYNGGLFTQSVGGRLKADTLNVTASGDLVLNGSTQITSASNLQLGTNKFALNGNSSLASLDLDAGEVDIASGAVLFSTSSDIDLTGNFTNNGDLIGRDWLDVSAGILSNSGALKTGGKLTLTGSNFNQASSGITQGDTVNVTVTNSADMDGTLQSTKDLTFKVGTMAGIKGRLIAGGILDLDSASLVIDSAARVSTGNADIDVTGSVSNNGSIFGNLQFDLNAASYTGDGVLFTNGTLAFVGGDVTVSSAGQVISNLLSINSTGDIVLDGIAVSSNSASMSATGSVKINGQFVGSGTTVSANSVTVNSGGVLCSGSFVAVNYSCNGQATVSSATSLTNNGSISANAGLALTAGSYSGSGNLVTNGALTYTGGNFDALVGSEILAGTATIQVTLGNATLDGNVQATTAFTATAAGDLVLNGNIASQSVSLRGTNSLKQGAGSNVSSTASTPSNSILYESGGTMSLAGVSDAVTLVIDSSLGGTAQAFDISGMVRANTVSITSHGLTTSHFSAVNPSTGNSADVPNIVAGVLNLNLNNGDVVNNGGILATGGMTMATTGSYAGSGNLYSNGNIVLNADRMDQHSGAHLVAANLTLNGGQYLTLSGSNSVSATASMTSGGLLTIDGALHSVSTVIDSVGLSVGSFTQSSTQVANIYSNDLQMNVNNGSVMNSGIIFSQNNFSFAASTYSGSGLIATDGVFTFNGTDFDAPTGTIAALNFINNATGIVNTGTIGQPTTVVAPNVVNLANVFSGNAPVLPNLTALSTGTLGLTPVLQTAVEVTPLALDVTNPNASISDNRTALSRVVDTTPITVVPSPVDTNINITKYNVDTSVTSVFDRSQQDAAIAAALALLADPIGNVVIGSDDEPVLELQIKDELGEDFTLPVVSVEKAALLPQTSIQHKPPKRAFELSPSATSVLAQFELDNGERVNWRRAMDVLIRNKFFGFGASKANVEITDDLFDVLGSWSLW